ncbi:MAG: restriction endonuclease subunit S [Bacteroidota bacterium]
MMENFERYGEYRESGFRWLEEIPVDWKIIRVKFLFSERIEKGFSEKPLLAATQSQGVIKKENFDTRTVTAQKDFHLLKLVKAGDFVISLKSFQGGIEIAHEEGIISPAYTIMIPSSKLDGDYIKHLFKSNFFILSLNRFVTGIREGQNIDYKKFKNSFLPVPNLATQQSIANFLDQKTQQIDHFIQLKEKTIALLEERKAAIINQAVTKGLDSNVPMKDSGIEWLGEIPEHWEVKKLKYCSKIVYGISPHESTYNIKGEGTVLVNGPAEYSTEDFGETRSIKWTTNPVKFAKKGDLLFCLRGSTTGRLNICHQDLSIGRGCAALSSSMDKQFFINAIRALKDRIIDTFQGSTFPSVTSSDLNNYSIAIPHRREQQLISSHIYEVEQKIDLSITNIQTQITLIKEYRASLISAAVTGKIKV